MHIHPIFTRIKDWTGDNMPDGIDALIEFQDAFGDPTKASGRVIFELYEFIKYDPTHTGERMTTPFIGELQTFEQQQDRWNRTSRTYAFPLEYSAVKTNRAYVLKATFEVAGGGRFFDSLVLEPPGGAYAPTTRGTKAEPTTVP